MTRLLGLLVLLGAPVAASARPPQQDRAQMQETQTPGARQAPPLHRFLERHAEELEIDEATLESILAIAEDTKDEIVELKREMLAAKEKLGELLEAEEPNRRAVMNQVEVLGEAEIEMRKAHLATLMDIRALLTPEQRQEIEERMERRKRGQNMQQERRPGQRGQGRRGPGQRDQGQRDQGQPEEGPEDY